MRAKPQSMQFTNQLHFDNVIWYQTDDPREEIEGENYFLSCQHILMTGDVIRVTHRRDDGTWDKAQFEVAFSSKTSVVVERITPWRHGGVVIMRGLKAIHVGHGSWKVLDSAGRELGKGLTKHEATTWVESMTPPPETRVGEPV